ncbi:ABC transporter permease [Rhodobacteraceae bacterium CCMM004]|nr:ABC transporter permease [Rhodobacteraceae bacterium CCMM004]
MLRFTVIRLGLALLTLVTVSLVAFFMTWVAGDPAIAIAGDTASAEDIAAVRDHYGLDRPLGVQYVDWASRALRGDFGMSFHFDRPVADMLADRLPVTLRLALSSILFAICIAIPLGVLAAVYNNTIIDRAALTFAILGQAIPTFWFALMMMIFFGITLRWLPISGGGSWKHYVMPTIALGYFAMPVLMRLTRAGMLEALDSDYIRTARAYGLPARSVLFRHALRNAILPVVALAAVQFGFMLGGSIVIETVFSLPGIGWLGYDAILRGDLPVVQAILLLVASFYVVLTFLSDLLNAAIDPRLRRVRVG